MLDMAVVAQYHVGYGVAGLSIVLDTAVRIMYEYYYAFLTESVDSQFTFMCR